MYCTVLLANFTPGPHPNKQQTDTLSSQHEQELKKSASPIPVYAFVQRFSPILNLRSLMVAQCISSTSYLSSHLLLFVSSILYVLLFCLVFPLFRLCLIIFRVFRSAHIHGMILNWCNVCEKCVFNSKVCTSILL